MDPILSPVNSVHNFEFEFFNIRFNIMLLYWLMADHSDRSKARNVFVPLKH
jgi:hypothetical protein